MKKRVTKKKNKTKQTNSNNNIQTEERSNECVRSFEQIKGKIFCTKQLSLYLFFTYYIAHTICR